MKQWKRYSTTAGRAKESKGRTGPSLEISGDTRIVWETTITTLSRSKRRNKGLAQEEATSNKSSIIILAVSSKERTL